VSSLIGRDRARPSTRCNSNNPPYRSALVRSLRTILVIFFLFGSQLPADSTEIESPEQSRFEVAVESAYLLGFINSPHSYEIGAEFITARMRWGIVANDSWLRGYHQVYFSAVAEPIFRGIENHYFGFNFGLRYNFVRPDSRFIPYASGGVGAGLIDSHASIRGAQGQDFTFNILSAAGVSYRWNDRWKLDVGVLYQHLSNGGQTDPNPSLNLIGPQLGVSYSF
jgi:opacity protein-like surface antigen